MESHGTELKQPLALFSHILNVTLVAGRGGRSTELALTVDEHLAAAHRSPGNAGDKGADYLVVREISQPYGVRFRGQRGGPGAAQVDVVTAAGEVSASIQ